MNKIPTVYVRDETTHKVTDQITPGCEWVITDAPRVRTTRKFDGACMMFDGRDWWARREVKDGKPDPYGFTLVVVDGAAGKRIGWIPITESDRQTQWHEAVIRDQHFTAGTYELIGPAVNGNPEMEAAHRLVRHGSETIWTPSPAEFNRLRAQILDYYDCYHHEGVVWHHPDGRMAKIKAKDFARTDAPFTPRVDPRLAGKDEPGSANTPLEDTGKPAGEFSIDAAQALQDYQDPTS